MNKITTRYGERSRSCDSGRRYRKLNCQIKMFAFLIVTNLSISSAATAESFNFNFTFDNDPLLKMDSESDIPDGTSLSVGDSFTIDLKAEENRLFRIDNDITVFQALAFRVDESFIRTADVTSRFFLEGRQVRTDSVEGDTQRNTFVGLNEVTFMDGFEFDRLVVDWTFQEIRRTLNDSPPQFGTTIDARARFLYFAFGPFFRDDDVLFVENEPNSSIPLPPTLPLFLLGMVGIWLAGRRRHIGC